MKYCPTCGAQLEDDARFCSNCGSKLPEESMPEQQTSAALKGISFWPLVKRVRSAGISTENLKNLMMI